MMDEKIKFSPNVLLIDVAFINETVYGAKQVLSEHIGRSLSDVDIPSWLSYLALDAGLREGDNEIQVILVHDEATRRLNCCQPTELESLNGMACRTPLGEFIFSCVTPADIADTEHLFLDLMTLAQDSADVERLMLIPSHAAYGKKMEEELTKLLQDKPKESCDKPFYFVMEPSNSVLPFQSDSVVFSLAKAFGIESNSL